MAEQLPGNPRDTDDPTSAIVLSGGGTRISFELGALSYLYQVERVNPRILAGTSAGAILAALLAQGPDRDSQADLLDRAIAYFAHAGYSLGVDRPYRGTLVPMKHYQQDRRVHSIMLEVNRDLYMHPSTAMRNARYDGTKAVVQGFLEVMRESGERGK